MKMKKLIAILTVLSILCAAFAVFAEETTEFTFRNGRITRREGRMGILPAEQASARQIPGKRYWTGRGSPGKRPFSCWPAITGD